MSAPPADGRVEAPQAVRLQGVSPLDGRPVVEFSVMGPGDVAAAIERVRDVQLGWGTLDVSDRARMMSPLIEVVSWPRVVWKQRPLP